jgi:hypothetical protein
VGEGAKKRLERHVQYCRRQRERKRYGVQECMTENTVIVELAEVMAQYLRLRGLQLLDYALSVNSPAAR